MRVVSTAPDPSEVARLKELAFHNALAFQSLKDDLVSLRVNSMKQAEVGAKLGVSQSAIAQFEADGNDPRLSTLQAYAFAVGARVTVIIENTSSPYVREWGKKAAPFTRDEEFEVVIRSSTASNTLSDKLVRTSAPTKTKSTDFVIAA